MTQAEIQRVEVLAMQCLLQQELCPEQSKVMALRPVMCRPETETEFGREIWFFEAQAASASGQKKTLYGAVDLEVNYGERILRQHHLAETPLARQRHLVAQLALNPTGRSRMGMLVFLLLLLGIVVVSMGAGMLFFWLVAV